MPLLIFNVLLKNYFRESVSKKKSKNHHYSAINIEHSFIAQNFKHCRSNDWTSHQTCAPGGSISSKLLRLFTSFCIMCDNANSSRVLRGCSKSLYQSERARNSHNSSYIIDVLDIAKTYERHTHDNKTTTK